MANPFGARSIHAWGVVDVTGALTNGRRITSVALTGGAGTGTYDITLDVALDANELMPLFCAHTTATSAIARLTNTSDTLKRFTLLDDAGAAVDSAFYFAFLRMAWGGH